MTSRGPFRPETFYDSMKISFSSQIQFNTKSTRNNNIIALNNKLVNKLVVLLTIPKEFD